MCPRIYIPEVSQETRCESRYVDTSTTTSLNGLFGKKEEESSSQPDLSVPTRVLEIPVSSIKQGGMVSLCFSPCLPPLFH